MHAGSDPQVGHGGADHILTYEDQDGDWMMVGDVPWEYASFFILKNIFLVSFFFFFNLFLFECL